MAQSTAAYYHSHPAAYMRKLKTDKKVNARPEQRKKRSWLVKKLRKDDRYGNRDGMDYDHRTHRYIPKSENRGYPEKSRKPGSPRAKMK